MEITILSCLCFVGLVFIGVIVILAFGLLSPVKAAPREEFLAAAAATLFPWEPRALEDIAARWQGYWKFSGALGRVRGYAQGVVKSLCQPDEGGWLAFLKRVAFHSPQQSPWRTDGPDIVRGYLLNPKLVLSTFQAGYSLSGCTA